jgi:outer membrane lipoprotein carrier protein
MTFQLRTLTTIFVRPTSLLFGLVLSAQALATAADDLKDTLASMNSFEAKFSQQVKDEQGELLQSGEGSIALAHPLKIRWEQTSPDDTLLVSDGEQAYYYDAFSEQVTVMKTNGLIDTTPFILLTTRDKTQWNKYNIRNIAKGYRITPKSGIDSQVEILDILFNQAQSLSAIKVTDLSGQVSSFTFKDSRVNDSLSAALFTFKIPVGVVVDDQTKGE